jgi:hypothetical protein
MTGSTLLRKLSMNTGSGVCARYLAAELALLAAQVGRDVRVTPRAAGYSFVTTVGTCGAVL